MILQCVQVYTMAHCHAPEAVRKCVQKGFRSIEHATFIDEKTVEMILSRNADSTSGTVQASLCFGCHSVWAFAFGVHS